MNFINDKRGFSLPEIILVVAVIGILITLTFPTFTKFMEEQRNRTEAATLLDIRRALEAYAKDNNSLPEEDQDTWFEEVAKYTNLSEDEIQYDVWGRARVYNRSDAIDEVFRETSFEVYYATVFTLGGNGEIDSHTLNDGGSEVDPEEWVDQSDVVESYGDIVVSGDDQIIKFTDVKIKTENYFKTYERLTKISEALESYSKAKLNEALVANEGVRADNLAIQEALLTAGFNVTIDLDTGLDLDTNRYWTAAGASSPTPGTDSTRTRPAVYDVNNTLFYPQSYPATNAPYFDVAAQEAHNILTNSTNANVVVDVASSTTNATQSLKRVRVDTSNDHENRREDMIALMRLLGLPDAYCCNALERNDNGNEIPFYYFSNPRPRNADGSCGTRPITSPFLPPRVAVEYVAEGSGSASNPATCE